MGFERIFVCFGAFKIKKISAFGRKVGYFPPLFSDLPKQGGNNPRGGGGITYGTEVISEVFGQLKFTVPSQIRGIH